MPIDYWSDYLLEEEDKYAEREEFYEEYGYYPEEEYDPEPDDEDSGADPYLGQSFKLNIPRPD